MISRRCSRSTPLGVSAKRGGRGSEVYSNVKMELANSGIRRRGLGKGRGTSSRNSMLKEERAGEAVLRVSTEGGAGEWERE